MSDEKIETYKCPYCNKTVAFKYRCDEGIKISITKTKPTERKLPHLLISRRCDRHECRQIFWVEVYSLHKID